MYARLLFVVVGIFGLDLTGFPASRTVFWAPSPWQREGPRIYACLMNNAIKPSPGSVPQAAGSPLLSVVVPTFNERDNVTVLYRRLAATITDIPWEVVFVDDNSPDGTWEVVRGLARQDSRFARPLHPPGRAAWPVRRLHRGHFGVQRTVRGGNRRRSAARRDTASENGGAVAERRG
jgi:cellulose synthase/poly-beta-1,6-N-acetylglucosamine synthase-like glycosyltransferase